MRMASWWACGAVGAALCLGLSGCSYADGAKYTVDGWAAFATPASPPSDARIQLSSAWSHSSGMSIDVGGSSSSTSSQSPLTPVGSWTPTSDARVFSFHTMVEVARPSDGIEPQHVSYVTIQTTSYGLAGQVVSQDVGDENDGWYDVHLAVTFDLTNW
jgi:hypothetical protein